MTEIVIVRHGQAAFGTDDYDRLTAVGWKQSHMLGQYFASIDSRFDACFTGSLRRQRETLSGIRHWLTDLPEPQELTGLNEHDFHHLLGLYCHQTGETIDQTDSRAFYRGLRNAMLAWSQDEITDAAETWSAFEQRIANTMELLGEPNGRVLVVTSGGTGSAILRQVLAVDAATMIELNLQAKNTGVSHYFAKNGRYKLNTFNAVPHLENADNRHLTTYT